MYTCKKDERDEFIKKFGENEFKKICLTDETWAKLQDIPIPEEFMWLFSHFLEIYYSCERDFNGNVIFRPRDILDYEQCYGVSFTYRERKLLSSMKYWAQHSISELTKDDD